jgi:hypothetical protein
MAEGETKRSRYEPSRVTLQYLASIQVLDGQTDGRMWRTGPTTPLYPLSPDPPDVTNEQKSVEEMGLAKS